MMNEVKRKTKNAKSTKVGRGGKRGKTSGRGHKGQGQHGSHGLRPQMRDIIKKYPKLRGHGKNRARTVNSDKMIPVSVNLSLLEAYVKDGDSINPKKLVKLGVVSKEKGKNPLVKILAGGEIKKKINVYECLVSEAAKAKIEKAGGSVKI